MTKAVPAATWEELGLTPADGLRQVLDGIRQYKGTEHKPSGNANPAVLALENVGSAT